MGAHIVDQLRKESSDDWMIITKRASLPASRIQLQYSLHLSRQLLSNVAPHFREPCASFPSLLPCCVLREKKEPCIQQISLENKTRLISQQNKHGSIVYYSAHEIKLFALLIVSATQYAMLLTFRFFLFQSFLYLRNFVLIIIFDFFCFFVFSI